MVGAGRWSLFLVGGAAIFFPLVYLVSDLIEVAQGDFTTSRLTLTYVGEAGFPLFVIGLCTLLRDRIPWWGLVGGIALGLGLARNERLPTWTGYALAIGVVLVAVASGLGNLERTVAAAVPDAAFVGMGIALIRRRLVITTP